MGYQSNSVLRSRANQLEVQNREAMKPERVVEFVTLYVSNDSSTYDTETADLIKKIERIRHELGDRQPYKYRLDIWHGAELFECSRVWFGDTSRLYLKNGQLGYYGPKPQPDWIASIEPTNQSEILDFNLKNINSCIEQIGPFEQYEQQYIEHMKEHTDSILYERKLNLDLNTAESALSDSDVIGFFGVSTRDWYNSFKNKNDTLNKKDYHILDLNQPLPELPLFSSSQRPVHPYLLHLLDNTNDITRAATGYLLNLKISFLKKLEDSYFDKVMAKAFGLPFKDQEIATTPASTAESASSSVPTETQTATDISKKSKKKETQLTTKQQMILLNLLGFLDTPIIANLTNQDKAAILAQLLNRSKQEVRGMLTYWKGVNAPKDYDCSQPDDIEIVINLLSDNNLNM